ncbi:MAG: MBL fold metallo-hydrolase [Flavobacteriaceae bacterium]|nr:MAG: MBL fold metallo-hydrolase [Flavobacteriaceae bacterium]
MKTLLIVLFLFAILFILFLNHPMFGKLPSGERLERIKKAKNTQNGTFQNQNHTPDFAEGETYLSVVWYLLFGRNKNLSPKTQIPFEKTDINALDNYKDLLIWFGHSSYYFQVDGKRFLVDPVFSGSASPVPYSVGAFSGSNHYQVEDLPFVDVLFISHDHWDHLDYKTIKKLKSKIGKVVCPLGVGEHLEYWGLDKSKIEEKNWGENLHLFEGFEVFFTPSRHFSGRGLFRNKSLWTSFVLKTKAMNLFLGGDSGYDTHFKEIGTQFGPFDLAILENGQYDAKWKYIHLMPKEILLAAKDLGAKRLLPVHSSKFALSNHPWKEPLQKITQNAKKENFPILTPKIGEVVYLKEENQSFSAWWEGVE